VVATGNFGGSIAVQADSIRRMADTGVEAVVVLPNMLVTAEDSDDALKQQLDALMAATGNIPLGLYECPAPYKRIISAELTAWAAASGRFRYLKDTTCDPAAVRAKLAAARGTPLSLYNAYTGGALESLADGAAGLSPIAANCYPELFSWLCANHRAQAALAVRVQRAMRVLEAAVCVQYVASAKRIMGLRGLPVGTRCRHMTLQVDHELVTLHESMLEMVADLSDAISLPVLACPAR
jgi:4-hydroxy-tetrahydrodipicolinate synthase